MIQRQKTEMIERIIRNLLDEIRERYITDASVMPLILVNDKKQAENLRVIDGLHQSVLTSLQFGQYRRAVWYLQAFALACGKVFGSSNKESVMQALQKRLLTEIRASHGL